MMRQHEILTSEQELIYQAALVQDAFEFNDIIQNIIVKKLNADDTKPISSRLANEAYKGVCVSEIIPVIACLIKKGLIQELEFILSYTLKNYPHDSSIIINNAAISAMQYGYVDLAEKLRVEKQADVTVIAAGAVRNKNWEYMEKLLLHHADLNEVVFVVAETGEFDVVENLLSQHPSLVTFAAGGAAKGGYAKKRQELIERGADINIVAFGDAAGGHFQLADELIAKTADPTCVASCAAAGAQRFGHDNYAEEQQIKFLVNHPNQFQTSQQMLDFISNQPRPYADKVLNVRTTYGIFYKAERLIALKRTYPEFTTNQVLSLIHQNNWGAHVYLLGLATVKKPAILKTNLPFEIVMRVFDYLFDFTESPLVVKNEGFGLFLSSQKKRLENERQNKSDMLKAPH